MYCPFCMKKTDEDSLLCPSCGKDHSSYKTEPHILPPNTVLHNRYVIGCAIGEGGFGITYMGIDTVLNLKVAVKEYYPNGFVNRNHTVSNSIYSLSSEDSRTIFQKGKERFLSEARILARFVDEPGTVSVKDFFEENGTAYIVMEYLDGVTLKNYLKTNGTMTYEQTVQLLSPVLDSLKKIHEENLLHRDISPDNIMLCKGGAKLIDFGAAREYEAEKSLSVVLKHGYAPIEQYRRHGKQGPWTDVYAICATIYKCITGIRPDDAPDRLYNDEVKSPSEIGAVISHMEEQMLMRGLAVRSENRIQSIGELFSGEKTNSEQRNKESGQSVVLAENDDYDDKTIFDPSLSGAYSENIGSLSKKKKSAIPIVLTVTVAVVVIAAVVISWNISATLNPKSTHSSAFEIPNFVGQNISQVERQWKGKINFDKTGEYSDEYEEGIIISQSKTDKIVKTGYTIEVIVSKGQRLITVPDMYEKEADIARNELAGLGFTPVLREVYDDNTAKGFVVKSEPEAGMKYRKGKEVQYFVSKGPAAPPVAVPNLVGKTRSKAVAALKKRNLVCKVQKVNSEVDKGKVTKQSVEEGTLVEEGTVVTIYVSTGKE